MMTSTCQMLKKWFSITTRHNSVARRRNRKHCSTAMELQLENRLLLTGPVDTDDQISEATQVTLNSSVNGVIDNPCDVDMYKFTVTAGQTIKFDIDTVAPAIGIAGGLDNSQIKVFHSSGALMNSNDDSVGPGTEGPTLKESFLTLTFANAGTYFVCVNGNGNGNFDPLTGEDDTSGADGAYALHIGPAPTLAVTMSDLALKVGETSTVTFQFSEAVTGFGNEDVSAPNGALASVASADGGLTWTAVFTPTANLEDSSNLISVNNAGYADAVGNTGFGTTTSPEFAVDTIRPTVAITLLEQNLLKGRSSYVKFAFSEIVTGLTMTDVVVPNGSLSEFASPDGGKTWTAFYTPVSGVEDATNVLTLDGALYTDAAGNAATGITSSANFTVDTVLPAAVITMSDTLVGFGERSDVRIVFSEPVRGFSATDITVQNGTIGTLATSDGGKTWTAVFTPSANIRDTTNIIQLSSTGYTDLAGNKPGVAYQSANYVVNTLLDFGDLPDTYKTLLASNGPRHGLAGNLFLGASATGEANGKPTPTATGDTDNGVTVTPLIAGNTTPITITASRAGKLDVFIDVNQSGSFGTTERLTPAGGFSLSQGANVFPIPIPSNAPAGTYAVRFRLSTAGGLLPTGFAVDGEVEDYFFTVQAPPAARRASLAVAPAHAASTDSLFSKVDDWFGTAGF